MDEMTVQTVETPYGNFRIPCSEGTTTEQLVQHVCTMMEKNGEQERLRIEKAGIEERARIEKEGEETRKTRQQLWDYAHTLAPVVIDHLFKSAASSAIDYYKKKQTEDTKQEKQKAFEQMDLSDIALDK